jgi:putative addiction module CopG family antidote
MTVTIPPEFEAFVDEQVKAGRHPDASHVVMYALAVIESAAHSETSAPDEAEELRAKIAVGLEQADHGELQEWDSQTIWAEVEKRHGELGRGKSD